MIRFTGWFSLIFLIASFYLACRLPVLNALFDGLKRQLRWHHWVAIASFVAMLFHLGYLGWSYSAQLSRLFIWNESVFLTGWVSFLGIILALPLAFFRAKMPYRSWRAIHLLTCVSLLFALLHTFLLLEPRHFEEWMLVFFILSLGLMSLMSSVVLPASRYWGKRYFLTKISQPRSNRFLLQLQPDNKEGARCFSFSAGQFVYLKFDSIGFSNTWHPFTILSRPSEPYLELFIKARGEDTNRLKTIELTTPVRILAPFGSSFWKKDQSQLWIAYGIGVAIFLAAIRSFPSSFCEKIHFICCDSSKQRLFFSEEIDDFTQKHPHFTWEIYIGTGQQFVAEFEKRPLDPTAFKQIRLCGHPGFQQSLKAALVSQGVRSQTIELEGLL